MSQNTIAGQIRDYVAQTLVRRARERGDLKFQIVAGDVHRGLGFKNRVPSVCTALTSRRFLDGNGLILEKAEGPPSGLSTTMTYRYRFNRPPRGELSSETQKSTYQLFRGVAKEAFRELGGAEEFIRQERSRFYDPGKDPLDNSKETGR